MPTPVSKDYISPQEPADKRWLASTLRSIRSAFCAAAWLIDSDIGEHRLNRVGIDTFDAWAAAHPDYPHRLQLDNGLLVVTVMYPPHDGAAAAIVNHVRDRAIFKCYPADCKLTSRTGRTCRNLLWFLIF